MMRRNRLDDVLCIFLVHLDDSNGLSMLLAKEQASIRLTVERVVDKFVLRWVCTLLVFV